MSIAGMLEKNFMNCLQSQQRGRKHFHNLWTAAEKPSSGLAIMITESLQITRTRLLPQITPLASTFKIVFISRSCSLLLTVECAAQLSVFEDVRFQASGKPDLDDDQISLCSDNVVAVDDDDDTEEYKVPTVEQLSDNAYVLTAAAADTTDCHSVSLADFSSTTVPKPGAEFHGYHVPDGTTVSMSSWIVHRNEYLFPNTEKFDPTRWQGPATHSALEKHLFSFGKGRR
ncbi:uncharacterized protein P174DRAFT_424926 [Aspergillus novofumigatus IBT 16806]|uniref:Cytochrome P450 n=1 Tax=Aspergillus novofumigatus (strain IBT 16806) TaxID=1392255 RepID=A0A2I1BWK2_ASPN1|nr:uncharacterized protein P174DRAFT_424926 [Aspergillus novofumigatus IBT 16806]PKX89754.1 hypothetical protein P174DRAFT_424926 [Aspergillus novofumigatus IBT 16806]